MAFVIRTKSNIEQNRSCVEAHEIIIVIRNSIFRYLEMSLGGGDPQVILRRIRHGWMNV